MPTNAPMTENHPHMTRTPSVPGSQTLAAIWFAKLLFNPHQKKRDHHQYVNGSLYDVQSHKEERRDPEAHQFRPEHAHAEQDNHPQRFAGIRHGLFHAKH